MPIAIIVTVIKALIGAGAVALATGLIKGLFWFHELKTNHVPHLQAAVDAIPPALEKQTERIVQALDTKADAYVTALDANTKELAEQRHDLRLLLGSKLVV
jgi:hypothetical protein